MRDCQLGAMIGVKSVLRRSLYVALAAALLSLAPAARWGMRVVGRPKTVAAIDHRPPTLLEFLDAKAQEEMLADADNANPLGVDIGDSAIKASSLRQTFEIGPTTQPLDVDALALADALADTGQPGGQVPDGADSQAVFRFPSSSFNPLMGQPVTSPVGPPGMNSAMFLLGQSPSWSGLSLAYFNELFGDPLAGNFNPWASSGGSSTSGGTSPGQPRKDHKPPGQLGVIPPPGPSPVPLPAGVVSGLIGMALAGLAVLARNRKREMGLVRIEATCRKRRAE